MKKIISFCTSLIFLYVAGTTFAQNNSYDIEQEFKDETGGVVLLKNYGGILPLDPAQIKTIALIGPSLYYPGIGGLEISDISSQTYVSPYQGIIDPLGDSIKFYTAIGANMKNDVVRLDSSFVYIGQGVNGFSAKYYNGIKPGGTPEKFVTDKFIDFYWKESPYTGLDSNFSARWEATLIPKHGPVKVKLIHNDGCRLYMDGEIIIDAWDPGPVRVDSAWINIKKGQSYNLQIDYFSTAGPAVVKFGFDYVKSNMLFQALEKAQMADVAIVFAGQTTSFKKEGDTEGYCNIQSQSGLIQSVNEVNPNTIVVMQTNSPADIEDWAFNIPAIIQAGIPMTESGTEIAEVLFGKKNPDAKMPFQWVMNKNQNYEIRYPFGHGLTYTTFGIGKLMMRRDRNGSGWIASVEIKNVGTREGAEVLQVYMTPPERKNQKSEKELKAFKIVNLLPGQKKIVSISIPYEAFRYFDEGADEWTIDPGLYDILVGTSKEEIKLQKTIEIKESHLNQ